LFVLLRRTYTRPSGQFERTLTSAAYEAPAASESPAAGLTPPWQPVVQFAVKIGCTVPAKLTGEQPTHEPATHVCPALHARPHIPQLLALVLVSTHAPEQSICPAGHVVVHAPITHDCPALHARPHIPQLLALVLVSTHAPEQSTCPAGQVDEHAPITQDWPAAHARPQPPQLLASVCVFTLRTNASFGLFRFAWGELAQACPWSRVRG